MEMKGKKLIILLTLFALLCVLLVGCAKDSAVTIRFYVDGELFDTYRVEKGGSLDDVPEVPEKSGYKGAWSVTNFDEITESLQVYAVYTPNEYTISFYVDDKLTFTRVGKNNRTIDSIPEVPAKEGYNGIWSVTNFSLVRNDTRVDAVYSPKVYVATFYFEDLGVENTSEIVTGSVVNIPTIPVGSYRNFYHADYSYRWAQKNADGEFIPAQFTELASDQEYYVQRFVTVTLSEADGTPIGKVETDVGTALSTIADPSIEKEEYEFFGWYSDSKLHNSVTYPVTFAENTTVYAKWLSIRKTAGVNVTTEGAVNSYNGTATEVYVPYKLNSGTEDVVVTKIGQNAFKNNTTVTAIHLPGTLQDIEESAFEGCTALRRVFFDDGCYLETVGESAFAGCTALLSFDLSEKTTSIGKEAFKNCTSLQTVTGSGETSLTSVEDGTFFGCTSLPALTLPQSVESIGESAFEGDRELTITILDPESILYIKRRAFAYCEKFSGILAINALQVGEEAYYGCFGVNEMTFDTSMVAHKTFGLLSDMADASKYYGVAVDDKTYAVPKYLNAVAVVKGESDEEGALRTNALFDLYTVKRMIVASGVKTIASQAMNVQAGRTLSSTALSFVLDEGLETIEERAFEGRTDLRVIELPSTVKEIGEKAFYGLEQLNNVILPERNALTTIGKYAFGETEWFKGMAGPIKLGKFILGVSETYCRNRGYSVITAEEMGNCEKIAPYAFYGNVYLTNVTLGAFISEIGEYAFAECVELKTFVFNSNASNPEGRTTGGHLLEGDVKLADLTMYDDIPEEKLFSVVPASLTTLRIGYRRNAEVEKEAYNSFTGITKLYIGNGYDSIEEEAFIASTLLQEVHIGSSVNEIGARAFKDLTDLSVLDLSNNTALRTIGESAFENTALTAVTFPATVRNIDAGAFMGADLTTVSFPSSMLTVGENAFRNNTNLQTVTLNAGLTALGAYAFANCDLRSLTLPAELIQGELGEGILLDNYYFTSLVLEDGLEVETLFTERENDTTSVRISVNFTSVRIMGGTIADNEFCGFTTLQTVVVENGVTAIGKSAFENCTGIRNLTIPSTVTSMDDRAFAGCTLLSSCQIDSSNSALTQVGKELFAGDVALVYAVFPMTITEADWSGMFDGCVALTTTSFPTAVKVIGEYAYRNCVDLTTIGMHDGVEKIERSAFEGCKKIDFDDVRFDELVFIGERAFYDCDGLHGIKAENATFIGEDAYTACDYIEEITVASDQPVSYYTDRTAEVLTVNVTGLDAVADNIFNGCSALQTVIFYYAEEDENAAGAASRILPALSDLSDDVIVFVGANLYQHMTAGNVHRTPMSETYFTFTYDDETLTAVLTGFDPDVDLTGFDGVLYIPGETVKDDKVYHIDSIGASAFMDRTDLTGVVVPAQTRTIEKNAFRNCSSITTLRFESGSMLTEIGEYAFASCSDLAKIAFPSSLLTIRSNAFQYNMSLEEVTFYANSKLTSIGEYAFQSLSAVTSISLTGPVSRIGKNAFADCENMTSFSFGNKTTVTQIESSTFNNCVALQAITIPATVTTIGANAFKNCFALQCVTIPNAVKSIGNNAFQTAGIRTLTLGSGLETIGANAFENCASLQTVALPDAVKTVGAFAFNGCSALTSLRIGKGVTDVGDNAFASARALSEIRFDAIGANDLTEGNCVFSYAGRETSLSVVIGSSARRIPAYFLAPNDAAAAPNLLSVTFEETPAVEEIGDKAFAYCANITTMIVPVSVLAMGNNVFDGCTSLAVKLEATNVPACFETAWNDGLGITPVFGYNNLTTGAYTYVLHDGYAYLTNYTGTDDNVTVPSTLNGYEIRDVGAAFENNTTVKTIDIPSVVTGIGSYYNCTSLLEIEFGDNVSVIRKNAFRNCSSLSIITMKAGVMTIGTDAFYGCTSLETVYVDSPAIAASLYVTKTTEYETTDVNGDLVTEYIVTDITNETIGYLTAYALNIWVAGTEEANVNEGIYRRVPTVIEGYAIYTKLYFDVGRTTPTDASVYMVRNKDTDDYVLYMEGNGNVREYEARTLIPWYAYADKVVSVVIGKNIEQIGKTSFADMTALQSVYYNSTRAAYTVNKYLFDGSGTTGLTLYLGEDVEVLPSYLMNGNTALTEIVFATGNALTEIGSYAFNGCTGLRELSVPNSVKTIGTYAFAGCSSVTDLTLGTGLTSLGARAFYGENSLVSLHYNPTALPDFNGNVYIFASDYDAVTAGGGFTLYVGENVQSIPACAFYGVDNLISISVPDRAVITTIGREAFYDCHSLQEVTIPSSLMTLSERAFAESDSLSTIRFGASASLRVIGAEAFANTSYYRNSDNWTVTGDSSQGVLYLNNVYLIKARAGLSGDYRMSDATRVVANNAFEGCNGLEYIRIPLSVEYVGNNAFSGCDSLTTVYVMSKQVASQAEAESSFGGVFKNALHVYILASLITDQGARAGLFLRNNFTEIMTRIEFVSGDYFLYTKTAWNVGKSAADKVQGYLVNDETNKGYYVLNVVGTGAMADYTANVPWETYRSLVSQVIVSNGITHVGDLAFSGCDMMKELSLADTITSIGKYSFSGCESLAILRIPDAVKTIGDGAFAFCSHVVKLSFNATDVEDFKQNNMIFAQMGTEESSMTEVEIARTVRHIPDFFLFPGNGTWGEITYNGDNTPAVKSVKFLSYGGDNSCLKIGDYSFAFLTALTNLTFATSTTMHEIGESAFEGCTQLPLITITAGIDTIGQNAFKDCVLVGEVVFNALSYATNEKGMYAFVGTGRTNGFKLTVSARSEAVPSHLFEGCMYMTSLEFEENGICTKIGEEAFEDCTALTTVVIPDNVEEIERGAFSGCTALRKYTAPFAGGTRNAVKGMDKTMFGYIFGSDVKADSYAAIQSYADNSETLFYIPSSLITVEITTYTNVFYGTFRNCKNIRTITYNVSSGVDVINLYAKDENGKEFVSDSLNNGWLLEKNAFSGCSSLSSVTLAPQIRRIGDNAFDGCSNLAEFTVGEYVESIGMYAFKDCTGMTKVNFNARACADLSGSEEETKDLANNVFANAGTNKEGINVLFGNKVTRVPAYMFAVSNVSLVSPKVLSVAFANGSVCTDIGRKAFYEAGRSTLNSIVLPFTLTHVGEGAFEGTSYYNTNTNWQSNILYINGVLIKANFSSAATETVSIANSTYLIADYAFYYCKSLVTVNVANAVKYIGAYAFASCSKLQNVQFDAGSLLLKIGTYAFKDCVALGTWQSGSGELLGITIRSNVTEIEAFAFIGCTKLTTVYFDSATVAGGLIQNDYNTFGGILMNATTLFISRNVSGVGTYILNTYSTTNIVDSNGYRKYSKNENNL